MKAIRKKNAGVDLRGQRAIVIGGTSGIGAGCAIRLAKANCNVTIVGRNEKRAQGILKEMRAVSDVKVAEHEFTPCDAFHITEIKTFTDAAKAKYPSIDYLVVSQGMATIQGRTETKEGIDQKLALHYFGRMAFILGLLPSLKASTDGGKVLSVLSGGVHGPYAEFKNDFELRNNYSIKNAADIAGFYNDLGLDALAQVNSDVAFIHSAPGFVDTNWGTEMPFWLKGPIRLLQVFGRNKVDCGEVMCDALFRSDVATGFHLVGSDGQTVNKTALHTDEARDFVYARTLEALSGALGGETM